MTLQTGMAAVAREAYESRLADHIKANERRLATAEKALRSQFSKLTGLTVEEAGATTIKGDTVAFEDEVVLKYVAKPGQPVWQVLGKCPFCGEAAYSEDCITLAAIGRQLEDFEPNFTHRCANDKETSPHGPLEPWMEKLAEALIEAIRWHSAV